jgi:HEPN domain-containing protein
METTFVLTETLQDKLLDFFDSHDIRLFSQNLRRQLIHYLEYELRTGVPLYFDEFLYPFNDLLDLLDTIAGELEEFNTVKEINKQAVLKNNTTKEKVIAFLKASLSPEKIFLLHHDKNNGDEYFDLLVVIPESSQTNFSAYEQVISMANIEHATIYVSLHKAAILYKQLKEGHIYYSVICNEGNVIYDDGLTDLPQAKEEALKAVTEKASNEFNTAHKKADSFLEGASNYYGENNLAMTAFMLQQGIELTLRGLIAALLGTCPKTHCFKELRKPLKRCAPELHYLLSTNEEEENRLLHLLEKAYLESRYTDNFIISDNDITLLTDGAEKLHERVEKIFKEKMEQLIGN